jgi:hypothetical protein
MAASPVKFLFPFLFLYITLWLLIMYVSRLFKIVFIDILFDCVKTWIDDRWRKWVKMVGNSGAWMNVVYDDGSKEDTSDMNDIDQKKEYPWNS